MVFEPSGSLIRNVLEVREVVESQLSVPTDQRMSAEKGTNAERVEHSSCARHEQV